MKKIKHKTLKEEIAYTLENGSGYPICLFCNKKVIPEAEMYYRLYVIDGFDRCVCKKCQMKLRGVKTIKEFERRFKIFNGETNNKITNNRRASKKSI